MSLSLSSLYLLAKQVSRQPPTAHTNGPVRPPTVILSAETKTQWNDELEDNGVLTFVVQKWTKDLEFFFGFSPVVPGIVRITLNHKVSIS